MFVHRNNDVIIDAKTLSRTRRLMLFSCRKKELYTKTARISR